MFKTTFAQNTICSKQHLLKMMFVQNIIFSNQHLLRRTFTQNKICSIQHLLKTTFAQNNICSKQDWLKITFAQNNICSKQHLLKTTFAQNNICSKQHLLKTTFAQSNLFSKQHLPQNKLAVPVLEPGLTLSEFHQIKRCQKVASSIILGKEYISYEKSLKEKGIISLKMRRSEICENFAKKSMKNIKFRNWYKLNSESQQKYLTRSEKNCI